MIDVMMKAMKFVPVVQDIEPGMEGVVGEEEVTGGLNILGAIQEAKRAGESEVEVTLSFKVDLSKIPS